MDKINQKLCKNEKENCMKKTNNQGFSLVELIIVIAIMAVLIGVLAPQFIRYVERSRVQKDQSAIAEVQNAVEVALADETVYQAVTAVTVPGDVTAAATVTVTVPRTLGAVTASVGALQTELRATLGNVELTSQDYLTGATIAITETTTGTFNYAVTP